MTVFCKVEEHYIGNHHSVQGQMTVHVYATEWSRVEVIILTSVESHNKVSIAAFSVVSEEAEVF